MYKPTKSLMERNRERIAKVREENLRYNSKGQLKAKYRKQNATRKIPHVPVSATPFGIKGIIMNGTFYSFESSPDPALGGQQG